MAGQRWGLAEAGGAAWEGDGEKASPLNTLLEVTQQHPYHHCGIVVALSTAK